MDRITAVIIVRDEADRLPACLASLRAAVDQIAVLDTGSTDGTRDLLARLAADPDQVPPLEWAARPFDDFSSSRTAALALVETPFWLWIDADERLSADLAAEIADRRRRDELGEHDLWLVRRENRVLGRIMRARSLSGQTVARLGRTGRIRLSGDPVHEGLVPVDPDATVGRLVAPLEHEALTAIRPYLRKIDLYTTLEARAGRSRYGWRQPLHLVATPPAAFWREYVWRGCWRDGRAGLAWAALGAWSTLLRSWKVLRARR
ncbi:MAG TPA: glycosyltransferase family 2 protein [Candidatus Krumholzibacteria bacterium]|nr:glycosyltransferase family 2 protein [Candidatus Krumholzibacteria bacterium]HPD72105.1 glycosyltransferase family 2 protein [Candidatus Krumholzibacteria bacterium]HRY40963.1 glycosyltransferase family 2 protein [Candidatus Krumholzibacteria bacterium]